MDKIGRHHTNRERVRDEEQFFYKFFTQKKMLAKLTGEEEVTDKKKKKGDIDLDSDGESDKETGRRARPLPWWFSSATQRRTNTYDVQASMTTMTWP
jgi:hypothetical protein